MTVTALPGAHMVRQESSPRDTQQTKTWLDRNSLKFYKNITTFRNNVLEQSESPIQFRFLKKSVTQGTNAQEILQLRLK